MRERPTVNDWSRVDGKRPLAAHNEINREAVGGHTSAVQMNSQARVDSESLAA